MPTAKKAIPPRRSLASVGPTPTDTPEGTPQPNGANIINQFEWTTAHPGLPFKSSAYAAIKARHARSKKTAKQILVLEQTRGVVSEAGSGTSTPAKKVKGAGAGAVGNANVRGSKRKKVDLEAEPGQEEVSTDAAADQMKEDARMDSEDGLTKPEGADLNLPPKRQVISYLTPQAPPSLLPSKKYCDITGLPASYTDPKTSLHFRGIEVLDIIRGLGPGQEQLYLAVRGAQQTLM